VGASSFPRHWVVYDRAGELVAKSGLIAFDAWFRDAFGSHTPWGDEDAPVVVTAVETALERELSRIVIDARPTFRKLKRGATLVEQDAPGAELFLLFEGVLAVEVDGQAVAEVGPGAILSRSPEVLPITRVSDQGLPVKVTDRTSEQVLRRGGRCSWATSWSSGSSTGGARRRDRAVGHAIRQGLAIWVGPMLPAGIPSAADTSA